MKFGSHVSTAGKLYEAVDRAVAIGCEAMQIFSSNPRMWRPENWAEEDVQEFDRRRKLANIGPLALHLPYLVNLASPNDRVLAESITAVIRALRSAERLKADYLVVHTGSHGGAGLEKGMERLESGLAAVLQADFGTSRLLLENTSGAGHTFGDRLGDIAAIISSCGNDSRLGLCLDLCHAYAAGYDLASADGLEGFSREFESLFAPDRLGIVHANDCKGALGSHLDRHEHIGQGHIGVDGFRRVLAHPLFQDATFIIETPKHEEGADAENLRVLRRLSDHSFGS